MQHVPKEFAVKHIAWNQFVNLQTCGEKQRRVRCYCHTGTSSVMRMEKGWAEFSTENHIEEVNIITEHLSRTQAWIFEFLDLLFIED